MQIHPKRINYIRIAHIDINQEVDCLIPILLLRYKTINEWLSSNSITIQKWSIISIVQPPRKALPNLLIKIMAERSTWDRFTLSPSIITTWEMVGLDNHILMMIIEWSRNTETFSTSIIVAITPCKTQCPKSKHKVYKWARDRNCRWFILRLRRTCLHQSTI